MTKGQVSAEVQGLADEMLVERLVSAHGSIVGLIRGAVYHARDAGQVLIEFKETRVPRGEWLHWLKAYDWAWTCGRETIGFLCVNCITPPARERL